MSERSTLRLAVLVPVASATLVLGATAVILAVMAACTIAFIVGMLKAIFGKAEAQQFIQKPIAVRTVRRLSAQEAAGLSLAR